MAAVNKLTCYSDPADHYCHRVRLVLAEKNVQADIVEVQAGRCPPKLAVSNLIGKLKGKSSYFLRQEYWPQIRGKLWGDHLWSPSYCLVSRGGAPLELVKKYVADQRKPPDPKSIQKSKELTGKKRGP